MANSKALAVIDELMKIHPKGYDLSLGRILGLLNKLGNPQDQLPPVIHVAGTNGKGSTIAFCRAMLEAEGKRVHVHTSPHLVNYHERYRLGTEGGGRIVADDVLADALSRIAKANDGTPITVFEILTAATFVLFSEHKADVALIEVGMGGRFDATNVMKSPRASVITPVTLDHENFLGRRVAEIAAEKAGIIKKSVQVVVAQQSDESREVLENKAMQTGAPIAIGGQDFTHYEENGRFIYQDENGLLDLPLPILAGDHQLINAATAIAAVRYGGFDISTNAIEQGMTNVTWPGRLQQLKTGKLLNHLPEGGELWVDGGHNPGAGVAISAFVSDLQERIKRPVVLIFGMLTTKDPVGYLKEFTGLVSHIYTVPITSSEAGFDPGDLAKIANDLGFSASTNRSIKSALEKINRSWNASTGAGPRVLICGTLYLVGDALAQNETPPE